MLALPMLAGAQRRVMGGFCAAAGEPPTPLSEGRQYIRARSVNKRELTLQNYFYSILHSFLNLEIANNFILEEDFKLRAAMYDVEPRAPR